MRWTTIVRDAVLLGCAATAAGVTSLAIRLDVPWTPPPEPAAAVACGMDEVDLPVATPALERLAVPELRERLDRVVVVDTRSDADFNEGHIPGAISLPAADVAAILASQSLPLPVDRDIVTYCDRVDGSDAEYVGRLLDDALGCDRVRVLEGGWGAWIGASGPVEGALQSG
ncbi:MAG TPA: rhodanese-like domain-containing protein [Nannocystaceae bacterium]|nr:rhodanese-like domain-containing protein [Nannocystaceae bacterium]